MILLDPNRNIKKYVVIGTIIIIVLIVVLVIFLGISRPTSQSPATVEATNAEKQKSMLDVINKANSASANNEAQPSEQDKKQQGMTKAINDVNKSAPQISPEEQAAKTKSMLDAINAANKK